MVYLVGGPVRDLLLDTRVKDLDFAVEGDATSLARDLADRTGGKVQSHQRFGTATVSLLGDRIDLVTARREGYPRPGALPEVSPGSIAADLLRRDFSINAMAFPLVGPQVLVDPTGGLADLAAGVVRTLHRRSFIDDPTRLFRAVRYEQRLGFRTDADTMKDFNEAVSNGAMTTVGGDRWRHELERCFQERQPVPALVRAVELNVMAGLCPPLVDPSGLERLRSTSGNPDAEDYLAALVCGLDPTAAEDFIRSFRLPHHWARLVRDTISLRNEEIGLIDPPSPSALFRRLQGKDQRAVLAWARLTQRLAVAQNVRWYLSELRGKTVSLSGSELLEMGVPAGPCLGEILWRLRDARLDGLVNSEEDERELVRTLMSGRNLSKHE